MARPPWHSVRHRLVAEPRVEDESNPLNACFSGERRSRAIDLACGEGPGLGVCARPRPWPLWLWPQRPTRFVGWSFWSGVLQRLPPSFFVVTHIVHHPIIFSESAPRVVQFRETTWDWSNAGGDLVRKPRTRLGTSEEGADFPSGCLRTDSKWNTTRDAPVGKVLPSRTTCVRTHATIGPRPVQLPFVKQGSQAGASIFGVVGLIEDEQRKVFGDVAGTFRPISCASSSTLPFSEASRLSKCLDLRFGMPFKASNTPQTLYLATRRTSDSTPPGNRSSVMSSKPWRWAIRNHWLGVD